MLEYVRKNTFKLFQALYFVISLIGASAVFVQPALAQAGSPEESEIIKNQEDAIAAYEAGDHDTAFAASDRVLQKAKALYGATSVEYFMFLNMRSEMLKPLQKWDEMAKIGERLIPLARKHIGESNMDFLVGLADYAAVLEILGRYQKAEPLLVEIVQTLQSQLGTNHPDVWQAQYNLAENNISAGKIGEARKLAEATFAARLSQLGEGNEATMMSMAQVGRTQTLAGNYPEAEKIFRDLMKLRTSISGPNHVETASAVNNLATVLDRSAKYFEAEPLYARSLQIAESQFGESDPVYLKALGNYANIKHALGQAAEAEPLYQKALSLSEKHLGEDHYDTLFKTSNLGLFYLELGRVSEAEPYIVRALENRKRTLGLDHPDTLQSLGIFAGLMEELGRNEEAEAAYVEELARKKTALGKEHPLLVPPLNNLATFFYRTGQNEKGASLYLEALELSKNLQGDTHLQTIGIANNIAHVMLKTGDTLDLAYDAANIAVTGLRTRRKAMGGDPRAQAQLSRQRSSERGYFEDLLDAAWETANTVGNRKTEMRSSSFAAAQDILSGSTSQALAQSAARTLAQEKADLGSLVRERENLGERWKSVDTAMSSLLANGGSSAKDQRARLRSEKEEIENRLEAIDSQLREEAPEYFSLVRPEPLALSNAQSLLSSDEAGLIVIPTEFGTHIMAISADELTWHRSEWTKKQIGEAVTRLLWDVGANVDVPIDQTLEWEEQGEGAYPFDFGTAYALYQQIVAPVAQAFDGKTHLFVMTSGLLASLPLGLLVSDIPDGPNGDPSVLRSAPWLADQYALVTVPNLQSIRFLRDFRAGQKSEGGRQRPFMGFGDPVLADAGLTRGSRGNKPKDTRGYRKLFSQQKSRAGNIMADVSELKNMASLPGTAKELTAMWQAFGEPENSLFLDDKATESQVRKAVLSADVIAFATHGLMAAEIGSVGEPGLVLTPPEKPTEDNDGYLSMSEVASLKMDTDWVILSACNTAAGDGSESESGLSGLARSFFFAGARKLLASNWPVRDDVSALLTVKTIEIARNNPELSKAQAFQKAMRAIRNDSRADSEQDTWAHPNAWAPFILVGDR